MPHPIRIAFLAAAPDSAWAARLSEHAEIDVVCAEDVAECLDLVSRAAVEAVVIDLDCGTDARTQRVIGQARVLGDVLVCATSEDIDGADRAQLLDEGATLVVDTGVTDLELGAQLRAVCRVRCEATSAVLTFLPATMEVEWRDIRTKVTRTQWKLLAVLCSQPGRYFTARELLQEVWGYDSGPTSTVSVHLHRLRQRLETDSGHPQLIRTMRGRGYTVTAPGSAPDHESADAVDDVEQL